MILIEKKYSNVELNYCLDGQTFFVSPECSEIDFACADGSNGVDYDGNKWVLKVLIH